MSLTLGTGPLSSKPRGHMNARIEGPAHTLYFEPFERRMRALLDGETVVDTTRGMLLYESNIGPVLYVPKEDVREDLLTRTDHTTHCPFKGDATYWSVGDAENAIWGYQQPIEGASFLEGYVAPYWHLFEWYEEDERLHSKFRDPYHRVDVRRSSARVTVRIQDEVVAETDSPLLLFETGLAPRAYLRRDDVREELLEPSDKETVCPYKGVASYWSVKGAPDAMWSYSDPIPEAAAIEGLVSFDGEGVEVEIERSATPATAR